MGAIERSNVNSVQCEQSFDLGLAFGSALGLAVADTNYMHVYLY
jgi:hypothetical protein